MNMLQRVITTKHTQWSVSALFVFFACFATWAQEAPKVTKEVDTTSIKIGEQIMYKVSVETDSTAQVIFPEGQTFVPLEMVEAYKTDTIKSNKKFTWVKKYALSKFDSGTYYIPKQLILVNEKPYLLDSLLVSVAGVEVDTTKQKMYDIKPLVEVEGRNSFDFTLLLWALIPIAIIAFIVYWFLIRKKPLTEEEKIALLPPFERAIQELDGLENSKYLLESNYKGYYSELTTIVKRYLEEEVHIDALESTTDELFAKIEMLQEKGGVRLEQETINNFKRVLQTADLVKFARSTPDDNQVSNDKKVIQHVVVETNESLPEPTEEELAQTEAYQELLLKKKKQKNILIVVAAGMLTILLTIGGFIWYYGPTYVYDTVTGHESKLMLEGEWTVSDYGIPPVRIETPEVLKRTKLVLPEEVEQVIASGKMFTMGNGVRDNFYVAVSTVNLKPEVANPNSGVTIPEFMKQIYLDDLEAAGAENLLTKEEEFISKDGVEGNKMYGSFSWKEKEEDEEPIDATYQLISFKGDTYQQNILIVYNEFKNDEYIDKVVDRIETSIEVNTLANENTKQE